MELYLHSPILLHGVVGENEKGKIMEKIRVG
jgi:hypothetical protein